MALNAAKVLVGTADQQSTTGAIRSGAVVSTIPATFAAANTAASALDDSGYVSEDGIELTTDISTTEIREWNRNVVRKVLDSFDGTIKLTLIQCGYEEWCQAIGAENVTRTAATSSAGEQLHIKLGAHLPKEQSWAFMMKDGDARIIIFVPRGQVTTLDAITFSATEAVALPIEIDCLDDGTGDSIHIFIDDGITTG